MDAARGFAAARDLFAQAGERAQAAEASNNLCVAWLQAHRPLEALKAVEGTPELFAERGDRQRAAQAMGNLATALEATGDSTGAERAYRDALRQFEALGDQEGQATILASLSHLQLKHGRPLEALASMQAGLDHRPHRSLRDRWIRRLLDLPSRLLGC